MTWLKLWFLKLRAVHARSFGQALLDAAPFANFLDRVKRIPDRRLRHKLLGRCRRGAEMFLA